MSGIDRPWYICGGWAIDLFVGRQTREHSDLDVAIARNDQLAFQAGLLALGWQLVYQQQRVSHDWQAGVFLSLPCHEVWATHLSNPGLRQELLLNEIADGRFSFRRDLAIGMPLDQAFAVTRDGVRFLRPEIILLYKATDPETDANRHDFHTALPAMPRDSRDWLREAISRSDSAHPWMSALA